MKVHIALEGVELAFAEDEEGSAEEGAEEETINPVIPDVSEMVYAVIFFGLLWALMKFVLLPPILRAREERHEKVRSDREAADRAHQALGEVQNDYDQALASARAEADALIDAARAEAGEHRAEVLGVATEEISALRADAASTSGAERTAAISSLRNDVGDIAVSAASAVLGKQIDRGTAQSAIDAALTEGDAS